MKILINYDIAEKNYLPVLSFYMKDMRYTAVSTSRNLTISELVNAAKSANCQGIFLCNAGTLRNLVPGNNPTLDMYRGSRLNYSVPVVIGNSLAHIHTLDHGKFILQTDLGKLKHLNVNVNKEFQHEVMDLS